MMINGRMDFPLYRYTMAWDVAAAMDYSAIAVVRRVALPKNWEHFEPVSQDVECDLHFQCVHLDRVTGMDYANQVAWANAIWTRPELQPDMLKGHGKKRCVIDGSGVGAALISMIRQQTDMSPISVLIVPGATEKIKDGNTWHVSKSNLIGALISYMNQGKFKIAANIPLGQTFAQELQSYRATKTPSGNIQYNAAPGANDDLVVAASLAIWSESFSSGGSVKRRTLEWV